MISPMTKYSFILLNGEQEGLLERLQEIGLVDITRSVKPVDGQSAAILADVERRQGFIQALGKVEFPEGLQAVPVEGNLVEATDAALRRLEELQSPLPDHGLQVHGSDGVQLGDLRHQAGSGRA